MNPRNRKKGISEIIHPDYRVLITDFNKWRLTYQSGRRFINAYLKRYTKRETPQEFVERRAMTYCPSFAKAAVNEVKNSIYQRMSDIKRIGGDDTYKEAVEGEGAGVDMHGASMDNFMGQTVLTELLTMKKVGIYVDMPKFSGETVLDAYNQRPYLYIYPAEDIRSWAYQYQSGQAYLSNILLRDTLAETDPDTGLPMGNSTRFRRMWLDTDGVHVKFFDNSGEAQGEEIILRNLTRIPFISLEISDSLLVDIADYQIALMNLNSSDLSYLTKANFPFYVEQAEFRSDNYWSQNRPVNGENTPDTFDGQSSKEIATGAGSGRQYAKGLNAPEFIHPSTDPITASMAKESQLKADIRMLIGLSLASLQPVHASAESKQQDQGSLESGLSAIGLTMEYAEREVAKVWAMYLGKGDSEIAQVNYPEKYQIKSDSERRAEATQLLELQPGAPSILYKKEIAKQLARTMLERKIDDDTLEGILSEIDKAPYIGGNAVDIASDIDAGLVSAATGSLARGYSNNEKEVAKAQEETAARLKVIADSQAPKNIQGVKDTQDVNTNLNPGAGNPRKGSDQ